MNSKKILFSIYTGGYPTQSSGGPNNIIYKLIKNSDKKNYKFDFLSSDLFAEDLTKENIDNSKRNMSPKKKAASYFAGRSYIYRKIFGSDFYLPYHFYKKRKYYTGFSKRISEYDIIHSHDSVSLALLNNGNFKGKKILTVHSKGPLSDEIKNMAKNKKLQNSIDKQLKQLEYKNIELADVITFPSRAAKEHFENSLRYKLDKNKVRIIYNGIDPDRIQSLNNDDIIKRYSIEKKQNSLLLLNVAGDAKEKKIDILLKIIAQIKKKLPHDILLINIGIEEEGVKSLKKIIKELDIKNNVKFLGKLPNDDVIRFLKAADIFIMTSEKVIFDLVVLEALASGACCVVSNDGGNKEIIKDGVNGFLIDADDIESSAKKILSINPESVKENAVKTAKQFSVRKMVESYFEVYESLLNEI